MKDNVVLEVSHLKKYFDLGHGRTLHAVDDVSFSIREGETLGLVGESGCGKTTCGRTCLGMYNKTDGQVLYRGKDVHALKGSELFAYKREAQMVFQDPYASLDPRMTVSDIIAEGMDVHHLYQNKAERAEKIYGLLEKVGLNKEHANRFIHEFSGGQRQRIGIARGPRSFHGQAHLGPCGRHVSGPDRGDHPLGGAVQPPAPPLYPGAALGHPHPGPHH